MYAINSFTGIDLPEKTLCITFDDGPGEHTYAIGKFLFNEGIRATFFVVGKYAYEYPNVLQSLKDFNHIIANHTYEHPDMLYYRSVGGNVQDQIIRTDLLIKKYITGNTIYFRSPYGKWSAEVAGDLNANIFTTIDHVGPIKWDIGGMDCYYWQLNRSVDDALAVYYKEISAKKKGIMLFHDDVADMDFVKPQNKTLELLQRLIPKLKAEGYRFIALNDIAFIRMASEEKIYFNLQFSSNRYLALNENDNSIVKYALKRVKFTAFNITTLENGKAAIQASNNLYLNVEEHLSNKIFANKNEIENTCLFDLIPVYNNHVILRATNGNYLTVDKDGLYANVAYMRQSEIFSYSLINESAKTAISLSKKLSLIKKRLLYIKSKILES